MFPGPLLDEDLAELFDDDLLFFTDGLLLPLEAFADELLLLLALLELFADELLKLSEVESLELFAEELLELSAKALLELFALELLELSAEDVELLILFNLTVPSSSVISE